MSGSRGDGVVTEQVKADFYVSGQCVRADESHPPKSPINENALQRPTWMCGACVF